MSKTVWKPFPRDEYWSIGRNESWFTDMASKGLYLKSIGRLFARFSKGEPAKIQYRIDVLDKEPSHEQLELYEQCGWTFVTSFESFYVFSSPEDSGWPELHTDPVEQGLTLSSLNRKLINSLFASCLTMVLYFIIMYYAVFLDETPYLSLVQDDILPQVLASIAMIYVFYTEIRNYLSIRNLRKSLLAGKPLNHRLNWKKSRILRGTVSILLFAAALYIMVMPFIGIIKSKTYEIPEHTPDLPVARLVQIEQNPALKKNSSITYRGIDAGNRVSYDWSWIAPVQYEVMEMGIIEGMTWKGSKTYSPKVHTRYYESAIKGIEEGLLRDLMKKRYGKPESKPVKIQSNEFESLYIAEEGTRKEMFACRGNMVIYVDYDGFQDTEQVLMAVIEATQPAKGD
jgi:hypothetical protein